MKNLSKVLISVFLICILVFSCNKDEDNETPPQKSYFVFNGIEYVLSAGILENFGKDADTSDGWDYDGNNLDLSLVSNGIIITNSGDTMFDVSGAGQVMYFQMYTSNSSYLDNGEYNFDATSPFPVGTFDAGDFSINWDENNPNNDWIELSSGKLTVNRSGSTYEISINCTDQNGEIVTGYYKGALKYYDYESSQKSVKKKY